MTRWPMVLSVLGAVAMTACTQTPAPKPAGAAAATPVIVMLRVTKRVQACWFKKSEPALRPYKMAAEINSFSGKPRILIVPRNKPTALPKLVAQAERIGGRTQFTTFGPLLNTKDGPRLNAQLNAWAAGRTTC